MSSLKKGDLNMENNGEVENAQQLGNSFGIICKVIDIPEKIPMKHE